MDAVGVWLLIVILFPFLWLMVRIILLTWKSVMVSRRTKNTTVVVTEVIFMPLFGMASNLTSYNYTFSPPAVVVVTPPYVYYDYDFYFYIAAIFIIFLVLGATKAAVNRRQILARKAAVRDLRARQTQVATVSGSVDVNSTISVETTTSTMDRNKTDLPPTYDEVMTTYLNAKQAAAAASEANVNARSEPATSEVAVDIEDTPPHYNNI